MHTHGSLLPQLNFFKGGESDEDPDAVFHFPDLEDYAVDTPFSLLDTFVPVLSQGMAQWWHLFLLAQTLKQYLIQRWAVGRLSA